MEPPLVGAEGSDRKSELVPKVGSLVVFLLGGLGSGLGYIEGGLISNS